jgi:peptide/nickel transport system ATP-binding protein
LSAVPEPDPTRQLDLTGLIDGRATEPANWPEPFTIDANRHLEFVDLGDGHFVRADPTMLASTAASSTEAAGS